MIKNAVGKIHFNPLGFETMPRIIGNRFLNENLERHGILFQSRGGNRINHRKGITVLIKIIHVNQILVNLFNPFRIRQFKFGRELRNRRSTIPEFNDGVTMICFIFHGFIYC
jgi:hypothetical protein